MNPMLKSVCDQSCQDLADQFKAAEEELLQAIHKATREAQLQETPLKFNIGFKIALDLEKSIVTNTLSWSVKHSLETSHQIEDPLQEKLPGITESMANLVKTVKDGKFSSMTISSGKTSVTIDQEAAKRITAAAGNILLGKK